MKTYVLIVSRYFPKGHSKEGQPTEFENAITASVWRQYKMTCKCKSDWYKLHTIRGNYDLWAKRLEEIKAGKACLSLRYWEGKPYRSKQIKFVRLTKDDGIGLQKLQFLTDDDNEPFIATNYEGETVFLSKETLANNDGLTLDDWDEWFKGYDLSKPMAIIHFTNFRY